MIGLRARVWAFFSIFLFALIFRLPLDSAALAVADDDRPDRAESARLESDDLSTFDSDFNPGAIFHEKIERMFKLRRRAWASLELSPQQRFKLRQIRERRNFELFLYITQMSRLSESLWGALFLDPPDPDRVLVLRNRWREALAEQIASGLDHKIEVMSILTRRQKEIWRRGGFGPLRDFKRR